MRIRYHEGIYYPQDKDELERLTGGIEKKEEASAIIVPHQALLLSAPLIRTAFSHFGNPDRVIILSPLHSGRIESDREFSFFEGDGNREENIIELGARKAEHYAEEEAGAEILLPFIHRLSPSSQISIIYTDIRNAGESKALAKFLSEHRTPDTLFLISTNLSGVCTTIEECGEWKKRAIEALESGECILDLIHRNRVHICNGGAVDSVSRILPGKWIMEGEGKNETTAHAVLWKKK